MTTKSKITTVTRSTYDPWISLKKLLKQALLVGGISILAFLIEEGLPTLALELPEYAVVITVVSAALMWVANWLKHKKDEETVEINTKTGEEIVITKTVGNKIVYNKD